ncbi:MAG: hypothetical protein KTR25_18135 [Myxococcales bacterium]|nr:hypothetical protein [Myxococcales bacterium]
MESEATKLIEVSHVLEPEATVNDDCFSLRVPIDAVRTGVHWSANLQQPGVVRDALLTMMDILASDLRFKARDRSDYLAYLQKHEDKSASSELWAAQKAFLEMRYGSVEHSPAPMEPMITVDADGLALEVFSADESTYARLFLHSEEAFRLVDSMPGTTYVPITPQLVDAVAGIRSYRPTTLAFIPAEQAERRSINVPYPWIRSFGLVQAVSTVAAVIFEIAPVDLYNVLWILRSHHAKTSPRALRYELIPNARPRLVLEPWDRVIEGTGGVYEGDRPLVVRSWGRKRLLVLARLLPHATRVRVRLAGAGMPAFYIIDLPGMTLTLALSGWVESGWSGVSTFDLLHTEGQDQHLSGQIHQLLARGPMTLDALVATSKKKKMDVRSVLLTAMQAATVVHDFAKEEFRLREMFEIPPDVEQLRYRDSTEEAAHRLLEVDGQVRLIKVHDLGNQGITIEGEVEDRRAHRTYQTSFTIDRDGQTVDATCTSPQFRRSGLKEGPSVPMMALRILYEREQAALEKARMTTTGRSLIRVETRTFLRRNAMGTMMYRMSLDDCRVLMRWGKIENMRMQRLVFATAEEAKAEYFGRLDRLSEKGFIDVSSMEMG